MMLHQTFNFSTICSTQEEAKKISKTLPQGTVAVVSAEAQEGGKGRFARTWHSPKGNLYLSFILPIPPSRYKEASTLSLLLATTAAEFLRSLGVKVELKWPNDLLLEGAKLGGILGEGSDPLFLGIGVNIATHPTLDRPTTSLKEALDTPIDVEQIKEGVIRHFLDGYEQWLDGGFAPFFEKWRMLLIHREGNRLMLGSREVVFLEADQTGGIWVEDKGEKRWVTSGEID